MLRELLHSENLSRLDFSKVHCSILLVSMKGYSYYLFNKNYILKVMHEILVNCQYYVGKKNSSYIIRVLTPGAQSYITGDILRIRQREKLKWKCSIIRSEIFLVEIP